MPQRQPHCAHSKHLAAEAIQQNVDEHHNKGNTNSRPRLRPAGATETGDNTAELVANTRAAAGGQLSRSIDTIRGLRAQTVALI